MLTCDHICQPIVSLCTTIRPTFEFDLSFPLHSLITNISWPTIWKGNAIEVEREAILDTHAALRVCRFTGSYLRQGSRRGEAVLAGGPTGLLGERGTVSPAGDLDFSGS